jgi:hypothetical protein
LFAIGAPIYFGVENMRAGNIVESIIMFPLAEFLRFPRLIAANGCRKWFLDQSKNSSGLLRPWNERFD